MSVNYNELSTEYLRKVSDSSKATLIAAIKADARQQRQDWLIGGPEKWSHDELVSEAIKRKIRL